ncbi:MAG: HEPN domain-containing protein [Actinobacteria bacterium]|nr:HEPN domain-containing protein [Actinomycetota bacterium]
MGWEVGRTKIQDLIVKRELEKVPVDRAHADRLLGQAEAHLHSSLKCVHGDVEAAYTLLYDAARKSLTALLEIQGLRPTSAGGHIAVFSAVSAQLDPPMGAAIKPFNRMRRTRITAEYPKAHDIEIFESDVMDDHVKAEAIVEMARKLIAKMPPF